MMFRFILTALSGSGSKSVVLYVDTDSDGDFDVYPASSSPWNVFLTLAIIVALLRRRIVATPRPWIDHGGPAEGVRVAYNL